MHSLSSTVTSTTQQPPSSNFSSTNYTDNAVALLLLPFLCATGLIGNAFVRFLSCPPSSPFSLNRLLTDRRHPRHNRVTSQEIQTPKHRTVSSILAFSSLINSVSGVRCNWHRTATPECDQLLSLLTGPCRSSGLRRSHASLHSRRDQER